MSSHRVLAPPPLALAIHPAPPPKTRQELKQEDEERRLKREKEKEREKQKAAAEAKAKADAEAADGAKQDAPVEAKKEDAVAGAASDHPPDAAAPTADVPQAPPGKQAQPAEVTEARAVPPSADPMTKSEPGSKDVSDSKPVTAKPPPPPPLRLLPPVPYHPMRARIDLNPVRPYPPINTDPRGAYHRYAKASQVEGLYVDLTKDGWLFGEWKERTEREALARLTGEADKQRLREIAKAKTAKMIRPLPTTAEGLLLELWNDLVEAPSHEIPVELFWARYDWSDPGASKHLQLMPDEERKKAKERLKVRHEKELKEEEDARLAARAQREKEKKEEQERREREKNGEKGDKAGVADGDKVVKDDKVLESNVSPPPAVAPEQSQAKKGETDVSGGGKEQEVEVEIPPHQYPEPVEWTQEGVEEILSTVGLQCAYNTDKPLPRHWASPGGGYLLITHSHFLLRIDDDITFKPEGTTDKFEALVTTANDRVFGEMVVAQMNAERRKKEKEYKERKEREYKERKKEKEKEKEKDTAKAEQGKDGKDGKEGKEEEQKEDKKDNKIVHDDAGGKKGDEKAEGPVAEPQAKADRIVVSPADEVVRDPEDTLVPPTPALSNVKVIDGEPVRPAKPDAIETPAALGEGKVIIAVPVKVEPSSADKQNKDEKHEQEPMMVAPSPKKLIAKVELEPKEKGDRPKEDKKQGDIKKPADKHRPQQRQHQHQHKPPAPFDPGFDPEMLIKMFGPEAANIPLANLQLAFAAMEAAAAESEARDNALANKKDGAMIWAWHEPCERWRWRNYAAGCAEIEDGGWEERDWKVFADDRGVEEFEDDMMWEETLETDIHDWSC